VLIIIDRTNIIAATARVIVLYDIQVLGFDIFSLNLYQKRCDSPSDPSADGRDPLFACGGKRVRRVSLK
jgi:hypothetical protein